MTAKSKAITVGLGTVSGALITASLSAFNFWIFTYTEPRNLFLQEYAVWIATFLGSGLGFLSGTVVGLLLSLRRFGPLVGAMAGTIANLAVIGFLALKGTYPTGDERVDLTFQLFVLVGAVSGFLTSLVISAIRSWSERKDHGPPGPDLQQPRRDRILF